MGLYDGLSAGACEERCREADFREQIRQRQEAARAGIRPGADAPQALRAETADAATATVETGVARNGIEARVLAAVSRLLSGRGF